MKKLIKNSFIFLFSFFTVSALGEVDPYFYQNSKYIYKFFSEENDQISQNYKILSVYKTEDYLFLDLEKVKPEELTKDRKTCYLKTSLSHEDMEALSRFASMAFSIEPITDSLTTNWHEPVPENLPFAEDPIDPVVPLPAPLPFAEDPIDPVVPLPAPLPFYEEPEHPYHYLNNRSQFLSTQIPSFQVTSSTYVVRDYDEQKNVKKVVLKKDQLPWSNNIEAVLESDFPLIEGCEE